MGEVRLIDAFHLRERIEAWIHEQESNYYRDIEDATTCYVLDDVLDYIDTEPTIDPESSRPVSRWDSSGKYTFMDKKNSAAVRCENCGCALHMREYKESVWKFCPVCGARMEGE